MKKKLTSEEEYSSAWAEAIEEDKRRRPEVYEENTFTMKDFIAGRLELVEVKQKSVSAIGAPGRRCRAWRQIVEIIHGSSGQSFREGSQGNQW